jgi:bacillithiol biosynthesis deacetylase BshB1
VRRFRPDIVLCNAIDDRHIDHARGSSLVSDACFLSGLVKIDTRLEGYEEWQEPWRPKQVYHYIQWKNLTPDISIDVTGFIEKKLEAIRAYDSQFFDPESDEPETPISSRNFLDSVTYRARDLGRLIGVEYAEGFTAERPVAVRELDALV